MTITTSWIAALLLTSLAQQQPAPQPAPDIYVEPPPAAWPQQAVLKPSAHADAKLTGRVLLSTIRQRLTLRWAFTRNGARVFSHQDIPLPYWPTSATTVGDDLVVAGYDRARNTIIQRWTLVLPDPPAQGSDYMAGTDATDLYRQDVEGRRVVRCIHRLHRVSEPPLRCLVQFGDSNDLWTLDLDTGQLTELYSSAALPSLADPGWNYVWSADHPTRGFIYIWQRDVSRPNNSFLGLTDGDRDGHVDAPLVLDRVTWDSVLGSPEGWLRIFE